jgi:hypothetical protein
MPKEKNSSKDKKVPGTKPDTKKIASRVSSAPRSKADPAFLRNLGQALQNEFESANKTRPKLITDSQPAPAALIEKKTPQKTKLVP